MHKIPEEIENEVNIVVDNIINYRNDKNLSWTKVFNEITKNIKFKNNLDKDILLTNVITKITTLGYDIIPDPFKLEKYK